MSRQHKSDKSDKSDKLKTKEIPWGQTATQVESGVWEWTKGSLTWRWMDRPGLNLGVVQDDVFQLLAFVRKLEEAGLVSEGVEIGLRMARTQAGS